MGMVPRLCALFLLAAAAHAADVLRIYFIDVEGGQATLMVSPSGQSLLVDAGWDGYGGRDAARIQQAARDAGIKRIDHLVITHFHNDHVGGVENLLAVLPVVNFYDHGVSVETGQYPAAYREAIGKGTHRVLAPGDRIALKDVSVTVVAAGGRDRAGTGGPNPHCEGLLERRGETGENTQSLALLVEYGKFRFLDPGDLTYNRELALLCPHNQIGRVDLLLAAHHGSESPKAIWDLGARAAVINNGANKGGEAAGWKMLATAPGMEDVWQLHFAAAAGAEGNSPDAVIANLVPAGLQDGHYLKVEALATGEFTITNSRNKYSKRYARR
jgi:beta-lactamase superfamily II metal-dependent hydrolase